MKRTESLWEATAPGSGYPRLAGEAVEVDVAIVGAGITGVTAALLLKQAGKRVALIEAAHVASGVSGRTSAHLTQVLDERYHVLRRRFGASGARTIAESGRVALELIDDIVTELEIDCDYERVPGYLFSENPDQAEELELELEACHDAGIEARLVEPPLPFPTFNAICFDDQAQFHPRRYLLPIAERVAGDGSHVFEGSQVVAVEEGEPCRVHTQGGASLRAAQVILATHAPINRLLLQTKLAHYRSYAVSGRVAMAPHGLFWDMGDPYHYVRSYRAGDELFMIVGGEDHKTGQEADTNAAFERLSQYAARFSLSDIRQRWSAQVIEPVDGLPLIGRNANASRVYVATGYSGNGLTFGTLSALLLRDACLGRPNPYAEIYEATRALRPGDVGSYLAENVDFPLHLVSDAVRPAEAKSLAEVGRGEGKIVRVEGERVAVYRDDAGRLHAVSPVCTHLGCLVTFSSAERTWDCPCHGSRFDPDGTVLNGPAVYPLKRRELMGGR